jgi:hypothetical protein
VSLVANHGRSIWRMPLSPLIRCWTPAAIVAGEASAMSRQSWNWLVKQDSVRVRRTPIQSAAPSRHGRAALVRDWRWSNCRRWNSGTGLCSAQAGQQVSEVARRVGGVTAERAHLRQTGTPSRVWPDWTTSPGDRSRAPTRPPRRRRRRCMSCAGRIRGGVPGASSSNSVAMAVPGGCRPC